MLVKARKNKEKMGFDNVEFVKGDIESIPLPDNNFDVVISNCRRRLRTTLKTEQLKTALPEQYDPGQVPGFVRLCDGTAAKGVG